MPKDVVALITADHRDVENLFERIRTQPEDRPALFAELCAKFFAHSVAEEEKIYPEIAKLAPDEKELVEHGAEEHHEAERILFRMQMIDPADAEFDELLEQAVQAVTEHVQEEESQVLPVLAKAAPKQRLEELGHVFSEAKAQVLRNPSAVTQETIEGTTGVKRATGGRRRTRSKGAASGGELSREELYEQAKEADIPGRSHMTKDELAKALHKSHR